jgi:hypothetical protein
MGSRTTAAVVAVGALALALALAACHRGPKTPTAAYLELERAVAGGDGLAFYAVLDEPTRWSVQSTFSDQKLMRTIISAKYPEAEAQKELARLAAAEEPDAAHYFARIAGDRQTVTGYRRRLGAVSGEVKTKVMADDDVYVARADGMPFRFHKNGNGSWGFSELEREWALEKDRASHAVKTVQDNAKLYQKAEGQGQ